MADQECGLLLWAEGQVPGGIEQQPQQFGITGAGGGTHQFHAALQLFTDARVFPFAPFGQKYRAAVVQAQRTLDAG